jgi:acetyl esterase/lipase
VAIVIHGGCWLSIADLSYVRPLASELVEAGWATWTLEFNPIDQAEGSWPGILQDVAAGADHLLKIAGEYSLDLERVAAVGHSSGGHLALWLSARSGAEGRTPPLPGSEGDPLAIRGVVGLAPVAGLEDFQARSDRCGSTIVARLVDSPPAGAGEGTPEASLRRESRLDATDPERMLPLGVAQLMIFGEEDGIVPPAHGVAWQGRVEEFGDEVQVQIVSGAGHFEVVAPWTASWPDVETALRVFLSGLEAGV